MKELNKQFNYEYNNLIENELSLNKIIKNRKKFIEYINDFNLLNKKIIKIAFYYLLETYLNIINNIPIIFEYSLKLKKTAGSFKTYKDEFNNYSYKLIISKSIIKNLY